MKNPQANRIMIGILLLVVFFLIAINQIKKSFGKFDLAIFINKIFSQKIKKSFLVKYYGVDKATLGKWIEYFCQDVFPDYQIYKNRRTLTLAEAITVIHILGNMEENKVLSKKDIYQIGEGNYRSLRESIYQYPDQFGITKEVYEKLRLFPPNISQKILAQFS